MQCTKSTAEVYNLRFNDEGLSIWADITLHICKDGGRLVIQSDYGSWDYFWSNCGSPFKEFLTGLDFGYLVGKLETGKGEWFDKEVWLDKVRTQINGKEFKEHCPPNDIKNLKEELLQASRFDANSGFAQANAFYVQLMEHCPTLIYLLQGGVIDPSCPRHSPFIKMFWDKIWNKFVDFLKEEINGTVHIQND